MALEIIRKVAHKMRNKMNPLHTQSRVDINLRELHPSDINFVQNVLHVDINGVQTQERVNVDAHRSAFMMANAWLDAIPEDAIIKSDKAGEFRGSAMKWLEAAGIIIDPDLGQVINTGRVIRQIPPEIMDEMRLLFNTNTGVTVRQAYVSLSLIYIYFATTAVGTIAAAGLPHLNTCEAIINGIAATALFIGTMAIRNRTTIAFHHTILRALSRGPEYYEGFQGFQAEQVRAAGMILDPNNIKTPYQEFKDAPKTVNVIYFRAERDVLRRSLFGHMLFENRDRKVILGGDPPDAAMERMYRRDVDAVKVFMEHLRGVARDARDSINERNVSGSVNDLLGVLRHIEGDYLKKARTYYQDGQNKFENRGQGSAAKLDVYMSRQFYQHSLRWHERIDILQRHLADFQAGKISQADMLSHLRSYYEYLDKKFTFDVIFNTRDVRTVDMDAHGRVTSAVWQRLNTFVNRNAVITEQDFQAVRTAIEAEYRNRRGISGMLRGILETFAGTNNNNAAICYLREAVMQQKTVAQVVDELVMQEMSKAIYRRGGKGGARSYMLSKLGETYVTFTNRLGTRMIMTKAEWQRFMSNPALNDAQWIDRQAESLMAGNANFRQLATNILGQYFAGLALGNNLRLDKRTGDRMIRDLAAQMRGRGSDVRHRVRMMESLEESFLNDGGNAKDFLREAILIAFYDRQLEWAVFSDADYVGSFDKDYVPLTIDPVTGEFIDIYRKDIPMFLRWSRDEKRTNISLIQNPQNQEHDMEEGPLDGRFGANGATGNRMRTENGQPLEPVARVSAADQQPWYGAFVLSIKLDGLLNHYVRRNANVHNVPLSGRQFAEHVARRLYRERGFFRAPIRLLNWAATALHIYNRTNDEVTLVNNVIADMQRNNIDLNQNLDKTMGQEVIESVKRHARDLMISTGIGPGRGFFNSMFSCGTCELEYVPGMKLGHHRPYVTDITGHCLAQAELRYNPRTRKMEIYDYVPRFADYMGGPEAMVESKEDEVREIYRLSNSDIAALRQMYTGMRVMTFANKVFIVNPATRHVERVVWWYHPTNEPHGNRGTLAQCRKVEVDYTQLDTAGKIIRDYDPGLQNNSVYYETRLGTGRVKTESFVARNTEEDIQQIITGLNMNREIIGEPEIREQANNEVRITVRTRLPEIVSEYHNGNHSERVTTGSSYQPDKWITEDMVTTYFHMLNGWASETHPGDVGSAVGPSDLSDLLIQHHRWFKGGPEGYRDFLKYLNANPTLAYSMQGKFMKQGYLWPAHTVTDQLLNYTPPAYWVGKYLLEKGIIPLATAWIYIPVIAAQLGYAIGLFRRVMGELGNSWTDIWDKEAFLAMANPVYRDAFDQATRSIDVPFATTEAGDRKMLKIEYLRGIRHLRNLNRNTTYVGSAATVAFLGMMGVSPSTALAVAGDVFNTAWPAFKWWLLNRGIRKLYGYWTSFDYALKEGIELRGANNIGISKALNDGNKVLSFTVQGNGRIPHAVMNSINEVAAVVGPRYSVPAANGGTEHIMQIRLRPQAAGGVFENYDRRVWMNGHTNFEHDLTMQQREFELKTELRNLIKGRLNLRGNMNDEELTRAGAVLEELAAEKERKHANLKGVDQPVDITREERNLLANSWVNRENTTRVHDRDDRTYLLSLTRRIAAVERLLNNQGRNTRNDLQLIATRENLQYLLIRAHVLLGNHNDVINLGLANLNNFNAQHRAAVINSIRTSLMSNACDPNRGRMTRTLLGLDNNTLTEIFDLVQLQGPRGNSIRGLANNISKMVLNDEIALLERLETLTAGTPSANIVNQITRGAYGVNAEVYSRIIFLSRQLEIHPRSRTALTELRGLLAVGPNLTRANRNAILHRIVGPTVEAML